MGAELQLRRGLKADLPTLLEGEPGYSTDSKTLHIGNADHSITTFINEKTLETNTANLQTLIGQKASATELTDARVALEERITKLLSIDNMHTISNWDFVSQEKQAPSDAPIIHTIKTIDSEDSEIIYALGASSAHIVMSDNASLEDVFAVLTEKVNALQLRIETLEKNVTTLSTLATEI